MTTGAGQIVSRHFIGRRDELERLKRAAAAAERGVGGCILVEGEPGIGKTRLVEEVRARFDGFVFEGQCYEEEGTFPFAPLEAGLRALLAGDQSVAAELLTGRRDDLALLLPELSSKARLGSPHEERALNDTQRAPDTAQRVPDTAQRALFSAVAGLLLDLAAIRTVLVVFEDLHWSDDGTLAFVRFLARRVAGRPVLMIATYRPDGLSAAAGAALSMLRRERHAEQLVLAPLTRSEVDAFLRSLFDSAGPTSADFLDTVNAFAEGNPLFVEELVQEMIRTGDVYRADGVWVRRRAQELRVPASMQDAVRRRSEALTPAARQVLTLGAVFGREFAFDLLATLTDLEETDLIACLRELNAAGFIGEEREDSFAFRHALLREAVLGQLLARERRAYHARVAKALEQVGGEETSRHVAELAYHYYEAGAWERALPLARRAAEQAQTLDATGEALSQYTRALDCAKRVDRSAPPDLLLARAELYERIGEFEAAESDLAEALRRAEEDERPREAWQALLKLGYLWAARDYDRSLGWFQKALGAAERLGDSLARAETLNRIGNVYLNRDQPGTALPYHEAALAAFESAESAAGKADTLELMGVCWYNVPDILAGAACEERALALAQQADARLVIFHASIHLLLPLRFETEVGPRVDAKRLVDLGEDALKLARAMGWAGGEAQALGLLGGFYGLLGQCDRALAYLRDGLWTAEQIEHAAGISAAERLTAAVLLELLAYDEAVERLRRARGVANAAGARLFADIAALALCQALAARGGTDDLAEADHILGSLLGGGRLVAGRNMREAWAVQAELQLAHGQPPAALSTLESLIASTRHLPEYGIAGVPRIALLLGRALRAAGRVADAEEALAAAVTGARAQGRRPLLWRAYAALGKTRLDRKERRAARQEFAAARMLIGELAGDLSDQSLREAFVRKALADIPLPPPPTPRRLQTLTHHGLTERERAVADLVAQGRSNRQIAEALVISERTAERHVANILGKLGLASRVQLASWVAAYLATAGEQ